MNLPKFLLADNSAFPQDIFVLHTEYPRFLINLKDDTVEWFEDITEENQQELANELETLIGLASEFYDHEMNSLGLEA